MTLLPPNHHLAKTDGQSVHRAVCYRCHKPQQVCICRWCEPVENRTGIFILQHGREKRHPIGTTRIAMLTLSRVQRLIAWKLIEKPILHPQCALLYPGSGARALAEMNSGEMPTQLVVLDGTWSQAQVLFRSNDWLRQLPRVSLEPETPSTYRIRQEPTPTCVSTIESIVQALKIIEPETADLERPLQVFDRMIEDQIALERHHTQRRLTAKGSTGQDPL